MPAQVVQRIREEVAAVDPAMPMFDVHTLEEEMDAALVQQRLIAMLSTLFGGLALVLACVGLYGLLAFTLVQRTSEMGIRMALGARRGDVVWLVVSEALLLVAIGIAVGVPAALAVGRARVEPDLGSAVRAGRHRSRHDRAAALALALGGGASRRTCRRAARRASIRWWC